MYKLVVVDDEEVVRKGLCKFISSQKLGFEVVASFEDGKEAIEYLKSNTVDVVLADIKMVEVSGLELARYVHENHKGTRVVIISGYKEFEYAKQAIEYNVENYLLKPTRLDDVTEVFLKLKKKLDQEKESEEMREKERVRYDELSPLIKEYFFIDLLSGALRNKEDIEKRMRLFGINTDPASCPCGIIILSNLQLGRNSGSEEDQRKANQISNFIYMFIKDEVEGILYIPYLMGNSIVEVVAVAQNVIPVTGFQTRVGKQIKNIMNSGRVMFNLDIAVETMKTFDNIYALSATRKRDIEYTATNVCKEFTAEEYEKLLLNMNLGNQEEVGASIGRYFDYLERYPVEQAKRMVIDLFIRIVGGLGDMEPDISRIVENKFDYRPVIQLKSMQEIRMLSKNQFMEITRLLGQKDHNSAQIAINMAKKYIEENYSRDISLEDVADHVHLNPFYLSRIFKQQTGESFTDFLVRIRMDKAIELLKEGNHKIYEVCEMIGYKSSKYFSRLFKQYTGYTPTEYCMLVLKVSDGW